MDLIRKLSILADAAKYDASCASSGAGGRRSSAQAGLASLGVSPPVVVSLAKEEETLFRDGKPVPLAKSSPALRLLMYVRDEAHRFANTYNANLRSKKIRESILDDFAGLGPVRRTALLDHFGSIDRLRAASVEETMLFQQLWQARVRTLLLDHADDAQAIVVRH